jgi:hypothetical protein
VSKKQAVRPGDVYELVVDHGFAYLQAVAKHKDFGWAMRVLSPVAESVGTDAEPAIRDAPELFVTLMGNVALEAKEGRLRFVGHAELPPSYDPSLPVFRASAATGPDGRHQDGSWWLDDGTKEWRVGSLTPEQQRYPYRQLVPALALRKLIDSGWDPQWEFKGPEAREFQREPQWNADHEPTSSFFLLFPRAKSAHGAAKAIAADRRVDDVSVYEPSSEDGESQYSVVAERGGGVGIDDLVALDEYFEGIAKRFDGKYDGNEVPIGPVSGTSKGFIGGLG